MREKEVYLSYAWGDNNEHGESREKIVDEIDLALTENGIKVVRDKRDLPYKRNISDFMKRLGEGRAIVSVIGDDYLKSPFCMNELLLIYHTNDFTERIFPIILDDAKIYNSADMVEYFNYWEHLKAELSESIKENPAKAKIVGNTLELYEKILGHLGEILKNLSDMNTLTVKAHRDTNFKDLIKAVIRRLNTDSENQENDLLLRLQKGSENYYKELTGPNGRFHFLKISDTLLGRITNDFIDTSVNIDGTIIPLQESLQKLWGKESLHTVLIGEGGMGKTVSIVRLWEQYLRKDAEDDVPVPIFVALNEYNEEDEEGKKDFITKYIIRNYLSKHIPDQKDFNTLWRLLESKSGYKHPGIILLLDGYNEITVDKEKLLIDFKNQWNIKAGNVQMVISSRIDMRGTNNWNEFNKFEIEHLKEKEVHNYLIEKKIGIPADKQLLILISNPMMLTIYVASCEMMEKYKNNSRFEFKISITTRGELLWNFIEAQFVKYNYDAGKKYLYHHFLLKHFLPYIAYHMEVNGKFFISEIDLNVLIKSGCKHFNNEDFVNAFPEYSDGFAELNIEDVNTLTKEIKRQKLFRNELCNSLAIMLKEKNEYRFLHQNFRDYFASVFVINEVKTYLSKGITEPFPEVIKDRALPGYLRKYAGEITGEHLYKQGCIPTVFMELLEKCRGIFEKEKIVFVNWNIINIWKNLRSDLADADFQNLDLTSVGLNGARFFRRIGTQYTSTKFAQSLINEKIILPGGHNNTIQFATYSSCGKKIISGSGDKTIKEWSVETGECLRTFKGHYNSVSSVCYSPCGKKIVSGSGDKTIKEWSIETGRCLQTFVGHLSDVKNVSYSPCGRKIISGSGDNNIKEWSVETGLCLNTFEGHSSDIESVNYSPCGKKIISGSWDKTIKEWLIETRECLQTYEGHLNSVNSVRYSSCGKKIISGSGDNTIKEWSTETGKCIKTIGEHYDIVTSVSYSPCGKKIISGSWDKAIKEWSVEKGECLQTFEGFSDSISSVSYSPCGRKIISGSWDRTIKEWSVETGECLQTFEGYSNSVSSIGYSPCGKRILSGSSDNTIKEWEIEKGECVQTYQGHSKSVTSVCFSPCGTKNISGSWDKTIKEWSIDTGECIQTYKGHSNCVTSIGYSPRGNKIISGSWDKTIKEWSVATGKCLQTFEGHSNSVSSVRYSPCGMKIISGSGDNTIKEWSVETGECLQTFIGHTNNVSSVNYNPCGTKIISGSYDRIIKEWSVETGKCLQTIVRHINSVTDVNYSPSGEKIISGSWDKTIIEWSVKTGECLQTLGGHTYSVSSLSYSPCSKRIISGSEDSTIKVWSVETRKCINTFENIPGLIIYGCSFKNLHPESVISDETKRKMKMYGAVFD